MAGALDDAARRWPEEGGERARLLRRLVQEGHRAIRVEQRDEAGRRRRAIERTRGALTGTYSPDYLERLRDDWPA